MIDWKPMSELPEGHRDGRELLCTDGAAVRVCRPKRFKSDVWEYHRDERNAPGHTWSMIPTHWAEINMPGEVAQGSFDRASEIFNEISELQDKKRAAPTLLEKLNFQFEISKRIAERNKVLGL